MDLQALTVQLLNFTPVPDTAGAQGDQPQVIPEASANRSLMSLPQLLNAAVGCMTAEEVYCEMGCGSGERVIAALRHHPDRRAYAVEDPQRLAAEPTLVEQFFWQLSQYNLDEQVCFCEQNFEEFFADWQAANLRDRIGVYFYNASVDYRSLLLTLMLVSQVLSEQALIIVNSAHSSVALQAIADFLTAYPQARILIEPNQQICSSDSLLIAWDSWPASEPSPPAGLGWKTYRNADVIKSISQISQAPQLDFEALRREAVKLQLDGHLEAAEEKYKLILSKDDRQAETWQQLGMLYYLMNDLSQAQQALESSLNLGLEDAISYQVLGLIASDCADWDQAIRAYQAAILRDPNLPESLNGLGKLLAQKGDLSQAESLYSRSIAVDPTQSDAYVFWGDLLLQQQQPEAAIQQYLLALPSLANNAELSQKLSHAYELAGDADKANLYHMYMQFQQGNTETAAQHFRQSLTLDKLKTFRDYSLAFNCFQQCGYVTEAIACYESMAQILPDDQFLRVGSKLVLPLVYQSKQELEHYRQQYIQGLETLAHQVNQAKSQAQPIKFDFIRNSSQFYLAWQGQNDRAIQACYGQLLHTNMADRYPEFAQPLALAPPRKSGKLRIGYIASSLVNNSAVRWAVGWLKHHDRSQFEIYCYSLESDSDLKTQQFKFLGDVFRYLPTSLTAVYQQLQSDQLDILVFLVIGDNPKLSSLAALRLAPIQCSTWGYPVTSGLPTIDYFLSGDLMEPDNAQDHYTEQLVRLPNIGICYPKPVIFAATKTRADFGLREDKILYLSCQLIVKYLPQYDYLFPALIQSLPQAQIVFVLRSTLSHGISLNLLNQFQQRLNQAFLQAGLNMRDHCVFLPGQDRDGYSSLLHLADVFLDTLDFSGGHTTFDAIAYGLPVVTAAGDLMRGRQSTGMLKLLGVTETIAQTEAEYLAIAVRLGREQAWRQSISRRMNESHDRVFDDTECVRGLESFYVQAVQARRSPPEICAR